MQRRFPGRLALLSAMTGMACAAFLNRIASASIVYSQPSGITTQPTDDPRWNSTLQWLTKNGSGTVIGPHTFLSAQHINPAAGDSVSLTTVTGAGSTTDTQTYTTTAVTNIPNTDLAVWQISDTFPSASIVPLYDQPAGSETGQPIAMLGYGAHVQDYPIITNGTQNGWHWGGGVGPSGQANYATNIVGAVTNDGVASSPTLVYAFTTAGGSQGIVATGDSGGGVFINVGGVQELAGINYAVTDFYSYDSSTKTYNVTNAAIYDGTGLYVFDETNSEYVLAGSSPQNGYASEIAPYLSQIQALIVPEPSGCVLLGLGALGAIFLARASRRRA